MAKFISFLNQKGGVGKTTLAVNVSAALAQLGRRVLYIDADPQGSGLDWSGARQLPPIFNIVGMSKPVIHREAKQIGADYDHVIIDSPPSVQALAKSVIAASEVVVIPVQPSPLDIWAAQGTLDLIEEAGSLVENLKTVFAINRKIANTALGRDVLDALGNFKISTLPTHIFQRVAFAESFMAGLSVGEYAPNSAADLEIQSLTKNILEL